MVKTETKKLKTAGFIFFPTGNSGNSIQGWCKAWPGRQTCLCPGRISCLRGYAHFINSHGLATTHQQGSVSVANRSQEALSSYKATLWNIPEVVQCHCTTPCLSYLITSAPVSYFFKITFHTWRN